MTPQSRRKSKRKITPPPRLGKRRIAEMIEEAIVDAYDESEQTTAWHTVIEENLATPFETKVFGVSVTVERVALARSERIVAVCTRGRTRQTLPILDLPLPTPRPEGPEWIEAYRHWRGKGNRVSEYQYYEFQTIDRPLTDREMAAVRTPTDLHTWATLRVENPAASTISVFKSVTRRKCLIASIDQ